MVSNKVKAFLQMHDYNIKDPLSWLGTTRQNYNKKVDIGNITIRELLVIANKCDCDIAFVSRSSGRNLMSFNKYDLDEINNKRHGVDK